MRKPLRVLAPMLIAAALGAAAEDVDRIAATVDDTAIPETEVRKAMLVSALEPNPGETPEAFRLRILDALIDQVLEYQDASRFGPAPPDAAELEAAMATLRKRLSEGGKDPDAEFAAAGLTPEDVRASLERQLVVQRYLKERFAPIAYADEAQARAEYDERFVPARRAAHQPVPPFEEVREQMRRAYSERAFDEEVAKWLAELRQKARISIHRLPPEVPDDRVRVLVSTAPPSERTPGP